MIYMLNRLIRRAGPDLGYTPYAAVQAPTGACLETEAPPPSMDDSAAPTAPVDYETDLMRYLLLSMAAAY
jgi:hypothetical protein